MKCKDLFCADYSKPAGGCSKNLESTCLYAKQKGGYVNAPNDSTLSPYKMVGLHSETDTVKKKKPVKILLPGQKELLRNRNKKHANGKHGRCL